MPLSYATPNILKEPGYLFHAILASTKPTMAALSSTYAADTWAAAWIPLGTTLDGSDFTYGMNVEPVRVAELFDAVSYSVTEVTTTIGFALADVTLHNLRRAMNAPTSALTTVSGAGATLSSKLEPPEPGAILRSMIGWESLDNTVRFIGNQALNGGEVQMSFKRGPQIAGIAQLWNFERPAAGKAFEFYGAGVARLGA